MEEFLEQFAATHNLYIHQTLTYWLIELPRRGDFVCRIDIVPDVLEWYATVDNKVVGKEAWTDWEDYTGYNDGKTRDELGEDMQCDLSTFMEAWLRATDARITQEKTKFFFGLFSFTLKHLELYLADQWVVAPMYDPSR